MKKFYTSIPLTVRKDLTEYLYEPVGNERLRLEVPTKYPILTAVNGFVEPGEGFRVIAVAPKTEDGALNLRTFRDELKALCDRRGLLFPEHIETVETPKDVSVTSQIALFQRLIEFAEDGDELFACITYGTKPLSNALLMAVQYAYRLKKNTSISCIVYGEIDRSVSRDPQAWKAYVYDETALIKLDEITRILAERGVARPKEVINGLLSL